MLNKRCDEMFDYSKKTIIDKFSELFSKVWFRFVFGMLFSVGGFAFVIRFNIEPFEFALLLMLIFMQGFLAALSIFNKEKYRYIDKYVMTTDNGEKIYYAIVRKTVNCHFVFPLYNLISLSFYIPHEVKYYLVRDAGNIENKYIEEKISPFFLLNVQETIRIKSKDLKKVKENSPEYVTELNRRIEESKESFNEHIKKFLENGLLTVEYESSSFSVFGLPFSSDKICVFYTTLEDKEKNLDRYIGFTLGEKFAEKIKANPSNLFSGYSFYDDYEKLLDLIVVFNEDYFTYLSKRKNEYEEKHQTKEAGFPADFEYL